MHHESISDPAAATDEPSGVGPPARRVCSGCGYDVTAIVGKPRCPECGQAFDPTDARTTMSPGIFRVRSLLRGRLAIAISLVIIAMVAMRHGLLPTLVHWNDPRLWDVFGSRYGVETLRADDANGQDVWWWGDRIVRIDAWSNTGTTSAPSLKRVWSVRHLGPDSFSVSVTAKGVASRTILNAINTVRVNEILGIRITRAGLIGNSAPFEVRGSKAQILSEIIRQYDMSVIPFKLEEDQQQVWVYDELDRLLAQVPVEEAEAMMLGPIEVHPVMLGGPPTSVRRKPQGGNPLR